MNRKGKSLQFVSLNIVILMVYYNAILALP
jgi:hypothetical protein